MILVAYVRSCHLGVVTTIGKCQKGMITGSYGWIDAYSIRDHIFFVGQDQVQDVCILIQPVSGRVADMLGEEMVIEYV